MPGKRKLDAETLKLWEALSKPDIAFLDGRKSNIISAYCYYRLAHGSVLVSDAVLRTYLSDLFAAKGNNRGYAVAMNLRHAFWVFWGTDAAVRITRLVRDIQSRLPTRKMSEWDSARTPIARLPQEWQELFAEFLDACEEGKLPVRTLLSSSTLKGYAEAMYRWHTFRKGDITTPLTGTELQAFASSLHNAGLWPSGVLATTSKVHSSYKNILSPGLQSEACEYVLRDLKGKAIAAGSRQKTANQIVSAQRIYLTGFEIMNEARPNPHYDISAAKAYRDGLLLAIAAALPLRRRTLASLELASSFRLESFPIIEIDISGNFLKLRQHKKIIERYRTTLINPKLWQAVKVWAKEIRPIFDGGTSLFPSVKARDGALVPDVISQIFGDVTGKHFGVRVPIHRVRDCVATECVEEVENGAGWAPYLLNHKWAETTNEFYVHASGITAARQFGELLTEKRANPTELLI